MTEHRLDPLLQPASIALLGASERADSPGRVLAQMVIESDYAGSVFPVNPGYPKILGLPCYADLASLPETVDHVIIALGNDRLEAALQAVIDHGARAATIYSSAVPEQDGQPPLKQRLTQMAQDAGLQVCGVNGMGFYNLDRQLYAGIFQRSEPIRRGGITYIAQSGSAFATLCHNDCRLGFNLCVSTGNEMTTTVADYMDWSLQRADTRVIGLFLETLRDPQAFVAALTTARERKIPVVVLKIGKSELGASMAITHTGAIAGDHAVFQALCRFYGVIEVEDFDEMAATLMMLQAGRQAPAGGLAAVFESGGFREMISDAATDLGIDFAPLEAHTVGELEKHLDPGLEAENPLDAWGSHDRFEQRFEACFNALVDDPNVAAAVFVSNLRDGYFLSEAIYRVVERVAKSTDKPVAVASCFADLANAAICQRACAAGLPFIQGSRETLMAFKHLFAWRDTCLAPAEVAGEDTAAAAVIAEWSRQLEQLSEETLDEHRGLSLLGDFSLPVVDRALVNNEAELLQAAADLGYPLVLKTAQAGIHHKSDCGGVIVGIENQADLLRHYRDLGERLGSRALLSRLVGSGIEVALGIVNDPQFGPLIMVASGGVLVELLEDRAMAMCPLSPAKAARLLDSLKLNKLLGGLRGQPAADREALLDAMVRLSQLACGLREHIAEIDINPLIVNADGALAVDALVRCRSRHR